MDKTEYVFELRKPQVGERCWSKELRCFWVCLGQCKTKEMVLRSAVQGNQWIVYGTHPNQVSWAND